MASLSAHQQTGMINLSGGFPEDSGKDAQKLKV
jgi:hypothetical protein